MTAKQGIPAKYDGTCKFCGEPYYQGDSIDRPSRDSNEWGHAGCVHRARSTRPTQTSQHPSSRAPEPTSAPSRSASTASVANELDAHVLQQLRGIKYGLSLAAEGLMQATVCVGAIITAIDPHDVTKTTREEEHRRRIA